MTPYRKFVARLEDQIYGEYLKVPQKDARLRLVHYTIKCPYEDEIWIGPYKLVLCNGVPERWGYGVRWSHVKEALR